MPTRLTRIIFVALWDDDAKELNLQMMSGHEECGCSIYCISEEREDREEILKKSPLSFRMTIGNEMAEHLLREMIGGLSVFYSQLAMAGLIDGRVIPVDEDGQYRGTYQPTMPQIRQETIHGEGEIEKAIDELQQWLNNGGIAEG